MNPSPPTLRRPLGFALPMTILAIAGMTLLLVGLMAVLSLERKTARSYSDATRAEFAVESGLAAALANLGRVAGRDDGLVFRLEDPLQPRVAAAERPLGYREQFFCYGAVFEDGAWQVLPFFSSEVGQALGPLEIDANQLTEQLADYVEDENLTQIGRLTSYDQSIPRARWVELPGDPSDPSDYTIRYAYWVEDLEGRLPGRVIQQQVRGEGRTTAEIDASTLFDPAVESGAFPPVMDTRRGSLRSAASLRHLLGEAQAARVEPYVHYLPAPEPRPRLIPQGFGYVDAGQPAPDLNERVLASDVDSIADHINRNLPLFEQRKGGFPASQDYLKTLAASIIDYADADQDATVGPDHRGVDSYPFVNVLFDRYEWVGGTANSIRIEVESYVELWNPSNQEIRGEVSFLNENRHRIRVPPGAAQQFGDSEWFTRGGVVIPPNGFSVLFLGVEEYEFPINPSFPPSELIFNQTTDSNFSMRWNGRLVDRAGGGLQRTSGNLRNGFSRRKWKGNSSPALDTRIGQTGDPRASYYIGTWVYANSYDDNSNWGGRVLKRDISNSAYNEVRLTDWPDGGSNSAPGIDAGTDARIPTDSRIILKWTGNPIPGKEYPANQPDMAPAFISNAGRYESLGELGHIFDPAQVRDVDATFPVGDSRSGGGFSLAIGRPEFGAFDREGQRSAQLLDLFSIHPELAPGEIPGPRINLNTAPREVLRCLVAGVELDDDPATPGVAPPRDQQVGDLFADFVLAHRSLSPLRAASDLNRLRTDPTIRRNPRNRNHSPFFGSTQIYPMGTVPPSSWDDAGREELMKKVLDLVQFSSNSFRIVVAGEVLDANGAVIGRATREYHYTIQPRRDPTTGVIETDDDGRPILHLVKHYERSL
jgi:hypothetical protein